MSDDTTQSTSEGSQASTASTTGTPGKDSRDYIDWAGEVETTLRAMLGLPVQILTTALPDETVQHLKAAGREGLMAVYSLWRNVDRATQAQSGEKVRKRIEVE